MNTSGTANYWYSPSVHEAIKSQLKPSVNSQPTSHFNEVVHYFDGIDGDCQTSLKRNCPNSDRSISPSKKRQYVQQTSWPPQRSADQTDDDDDDDDDDEGDWSSVNNPTGVTEKNPDVKQNDNRRRAAHTAAEQKRRNAIRKGYDALQSLVPNSHLLDPISSQKVSKAAILKRSTDYLAELNKEKQQISAQLDDRRTDTYCLRAVQKTYEEILQTNLLSSKNATATIDDEQKFKIFQAIADELFISFDQAMQTSQATDFSQFTSTMLRWIEDSCRPANIDDIIRRTTTNRTS